MKVSNNKKYSKEQIEQMIIAECKKWGVPPALALGIAKHESGLRADELSPKNSDGTRDQGVFQLNSKYFKMKNWADPRENISRGVQHIAALQKTFGNNIRNILMAYNAGSGAVQSGKVPSFTKNNYVPKAMRQIQSYQSALKSNDGKLNREVQSLENIAIGRNNNMSANNNIVTGAAADVQLSPESQALLNPQTLSAENLNTLLTNARKGDTEAIKDYRTQVNQLMNAYDNPSIVIGQDDNGEDIKISPWEYDQLRQQQVQNNLATQRQQAMQTVNPYTPEAQAYTQGMYDRLNNLYQDQLNAIRGTYPTGYQGVDPDYLRWNLQTSGGAGIAAGAAGSTQDLANAFANNAAMLRQADQVRYEQQVANQMGIPYAQYIQMKQAEAAAAQNTLNQMATVSQNDMSRLGTSATAAGNIYKTDAALAQSQIDNMEAARQFDATLRAKYGDQDAQILKQQMINNGNYFNNVMAYQQALDTAKTNRSSNIAGNIVSGEYGLGRQRVINAGNLAQQDLQNQGTYNTQLLRGTQDYEIEKYKNENPITANKNLSQAVSNYAMARFVDPNATGQIIGSMPTGLTQKYLPNYEAATLNPNQRRVSPLTRENLLQDWLYGNSNQ